MEYVKISLNRYEDLKESEEIYHALASGKKSFKFKVKCVEALEYVSFSFKHKMEEAQVTNHIYYNKTDATVVLDKKIAQLQKDLDDSLFIIDNMEKAAEKLSRQQIERIPEIKPWWKIFIPKRWR